MGYKYIYIYIYVCVCVCNALKSDVFELRLYSRNDVGIVHKHRAQCLVHDNVSPSADIHILKLGS